MTVGSLLIHGGYRGGFSLLVSVYDGTGGVPETDAHLESAGLEKMSPPSPVVSGRQHSVGKQVHSQHVIHLIFVFKHTYFHRKYHSSCNFIVGFVEEEGRLPPHFYLSQEIIRCGTV